MRVIIKEQKYRICKGASIQEVVSTLEKKHYGCGLELGLDNWVKVIPNEGEF